MYKNNSMNENNSIWSDRLRERKQQKIVESVWVNRLRERNEDIVYDDNIKVDVLEEIETLYKQSKKK
jgi:hypothetical protein